MRIQEFYLHICPILTFFTLVFFTSSCIHCACCFYSLFNFISMCGLLAVKQTPSQGQSLSLPPLSTLSLSNLLLIHYCFSNQSKVNSFKRGFKALHANTVLALIKFNFSSHLPYRHTYVTNKFIYFCSLSLLLAQSQCTHLPPPIPTTFPLSFPPSLPALPLLSPSYSF